MAIFPFNDVTAMIQQVDPARLIAHLRRLTGEEPICLPRGCIVIRDRLTGSSDLQWAKDYVIQELNDLGYSVEIQDWSLAGHADQNLLIRKTGITNPNQEIFFVAHLDGATGSPAADDNGSGVVALLELARSLRHHVFAETIVLMISTGEEEGVLGVHDYVDHLTPTQLSRIRYVIDVDMIGYDSNGDAVMGLWNGTQPLDFVEYLSGIMDAYQVNLVPQVVSDCG